MPFFINWSIVWHGKNFMILMAFSCAAMFLFFLIQCLGIVPTPGIHRLNVSEIESNIMFLIDVEK